MNQITVNSIYGKKKPLRTPWLIYALFRKLFVLTNGRSNDFASWLVSIFNPPKVQPQIELSTLGISNKQTVKKAVDAISTNGYYIFENKLSPSVVEKIVDYANSCEVFPLEKDDKGNYNYSSTKRLLNRADVDSPRFQLDQKDIFKSEELCKVIFDPGILAVASNYLKCEPIMDMVAMWWSKPSSSGESAAGQMYHFDMDKIKFLKFFFYLTDVDESTGPHCYIENTHKKLPKELKRDGRFTDEEVENVFQKERIKKLKGLSGSIMAVDTRGLHKGEPLIKGERLIFQVEFCNSMFGKNYDLIPLSSVFEKYQRAIASNSKIYGRIFK
ncbi:MAG: phytanoyl-CoA dioxygenase family protein [Bdellovibrionota bacterium]